MTTDYYFRGIIQETEDSIIQPYGEIGVTLYEGPSGAGLGSISASMGIWNSFHGGDTGADGSGTTDPNSGTNPTSTPALPLVSPAASNSASPTPCTPAQRLVQRRRRVVHQPEL